MKYLIVISVISLALTCCSPKIYPTESSQNRVLIHEHIVHDTTVIVLPPPMAEKNVTPLRFSHLENDWAKSDASVDSLGLLHHSLETKPHEVPVPTETPVRDTVSHEATTITTTEYVDKPLKWYQKTLMWLGVAFITVVVATIVKLKIKTTLK